MSAYDPKEPFAVKQMKATFLISLIVLVTKVGAANELSCEMRDNDLLECPSVVAPLVTELSEGFVELEFTVQPDGSVHDVRLVESGGDKRWIDAAAATVSQWKYRASDKSVEKAQRFSFEAMGSNCTLSFSPADVAEFIQGTPDSDVALTARRKDDAIIGYGIYNIQNVKRFLDVGLRNGDVLVSVCGIPVTDVFGGDRESFRESSFCCNSDSGEPVLIFERRSKGKIIPIRFLEVIRVPFL